LSSYSTELVEEILHRRVGREGGEEVRIERVQLELGAEDEVLRECGAREGDARDRGGKAAEHGFDGR
jgi:hypothetical protein